MEGDDVWVSEVLENLDFAIEVLFQLLVETREIDGLDGDSGARDLKKSRSQYCKFFKRNGECNKGAGKLQQSLCCIKLLCCHS